MGLKTVWYRPEHTKDQKKKDDYTAAITNSRIIVDRLTEILNQEEETLSGIEYDLENYTGDWATKQAHINGTRSHIKKMLSILTF